MTLARMWRPLFWAALLFAFLMAVLPHLPMVPGAPSDKVQHIAAFLVLGSLAALAYPRAALLVLLTGLSLFGGLIELVQGIPALNRDSEMLDWLADTVAAAVALFAARGMRRPGGP